MQDCFSIKNKIYIFTLLVLSFCLFGCIFHDKATVSRQKEALQTKIRNYEALQEAILSQSIQKGTSASRIRQEYGEPDDIFSSGSTTGRFEIWTYEKAVARDPTDWHPIRLYFNSEKLVSWNY